MGLGNPGPRYDDTRHNVGWWVVDRLAYDRDFGPFEREGPSLASQGSVDGRTVRLIKPSTYMNRSGAALSTLRHLEEFDVSTDLLVVVDDATLEVGRVRFRPSGGPGGHNGLRSVEEALGTDAYPRLRIGVGRPPEGEDWSDWVLSSMPPEDEEAVVELLPELSEAICLWVAEGTESAMNRYNR